MASVEVMFAKWMSVRKTWRIHSYSGEFSGLRCRYRQECWRKKCRDLWKRDSATFIAD